MHINIEPMTVDDAKSVAEIHPESWQFAYKGIVPKPYLDGINVKRREESWARGIIEDTSLIRLVARDECNSVLGFVCGLHNRDLNQNIDGELWAIYVSPKKTKHGIGKTLFNSFVMELKNRNFSTMNVWVLENNHLARSFYEKMGGSLSSLKKNIEIGGKELVEVSYDFKL